MGKCPKCDAYNSFQEEVIAVPGKTKVRSARGLSGRSTPQRIAEIGGDAEERLPVPIEEFSRVLGGGIVPGSVVLIGGDPGIGKSTLLLQMALAMAAVGTDGSSTVLYVSGEESERQIKMRGTRLLQNQNGEKTGGGFPTDLFLVTETNLDVLLQHVQEVKPQLLIVDSIQPRISLIKIHLQVLSPRYASRPLSCAN